MKINNIYLYFLSFSYLIKYYIYKKIFSFSFLTTKLYKIKIKKNTAAINDLNKYVEILNFSSSFMGIDSCLVRSMALFQLLKQNNFYPSFIIGIYKFNSNFRSHCWIEVNNIPINETKDILKFSEMMRIA